MQFLANPDFGFDNDPVLKSPGAFQPGNMMNGAYPGQVGVSAAQGFRGGQNAPDIFKRFGMRAAERSPQFSLGEAMPQNNGTWALPTMNAAPAGPGPEMASTGMPGGNRFEKFFGNSFGGAGYLVDTMNEDTRGIRGTLNNFLTNNMGRLTPQVGVAPRTQVGSVGNVNFGPGAERISPEMINGVPQVDSARWAGMGGIDPFGRRDVRDVAGGNVQSFAPTQSVDQLGGANSAFFQNMMNQLRPAFDQRRAAALAQAKESAGNLTGSSLAEGLGDVVNRSLGEEQAALAQFAAQGLGMEVNRQGNMAGLENTRNIAQAGNELTAGQANQDADLGFLDALMRRGQLGLQSGELGMRGDLANQDAEIRRLLANQGVATTAAQSNQNASIAEMETRLRASGMDQDTARAIALQQAEIGSREGMNEFNARNEMENANAERVARLMQSMATAGVGPREVATSDGWGAMLPGAATALGTFGGGMLGGAGNAIGQGIGNGLGRLFGFGGGPSSGLPAGGVQVNGMPVDPMNPGAGTFTSTVGAMGPNALVATGRGFAGQTAPGASWLGGAGNFGGRFLSGSMGGAAGTLGGAAGGGLLGTAYGSMTNHDADTRRNMSKGGMVGGAIGSIGGPIGTLIGSGIGTALGSINENKGRTTNIWRPSKWRL